MAAPLTGKFLFVFFNNVYLKNFRGFYCSCIPKGLKVSRNAPRRTIIHSKSNFNMPPKPTVPKTSVVYPQARRDDKVTDNFFGITIKDPYRWLENSDSKETQQFVYDQNLNTRSYIDSCSSKKDVQDTLTQVWDYPKYSCPFREQTGYFFFKNSGLQNQSVLYMQKDLFSQPVTFFDPNQLSQDGTEALSTWNFSHDGNTFAYGISSRGSDWLKIHFKDVVSKKDYPEVLERVKFTTITWTLDNKGIFYSMYPHQAKDKENLETVLDENQKLYYHVLGNPQSEDILVFDYPNDPKFRISTDITYCGRYLIIYLQKRCRDNLVYFSDLESINYKIAARLPIEFVVTKLEYDFEYVNNMGSEVIFRTNKDAPNYKLIKINFGSPEESHWTTFLEENPTDVLNWAVPVNKNKLCISYMRNVNDLLQYHDALDGRLLHTFSLPIGNLIGFSGKRYFTDIFFKVCSFLTPGVIYRCNLNDPDLDLEVFQEVTPPGLRKEDYVIEQVFYSSKDGTKVPMFIIHKKGIHKNGENPCLLYGYGGFNISIKPFFNPTMVVFMENFCGVLAVPNIRGGGEFGEKWHNSGRLLKKQNSFDDFIKAAEFLIEKGYTNSTLLTTKGDSNGGLLVAACALQRPELFGAVLCGVGVLDMLRFHKFTIGSAWVSDYGSSDSEEHFQYLLKYSPLHNVKIPGSQIEFQYPPMLLTTADHDDRVVPFHSLKFIATLQYAAGQSIKQKNPLLIRIDTKAGHGAGKPTTKMIEEAADILCFLINVQGLDFQTASDKY